MYESELKLERVGFPPFCARHCQQTLTPVLNGAFMRTVNGQLVYTGRKEHHKFQSTIRCQDKLVPSLDGIWRGSSLTVECLQRLSQEITVGEEITLSRDPVDHSVFAMDHQQQPYEILAVKGRSVFLKDNGEEGFRQTGYKLYLFYRPRLHMCVMSYHVMTDEWGFSCGWQLDLEEI